MSTVITYLKMPATTVTCPDAVAYYVYVADSPGEDDAIARRGVEAGSALGPDVAAGFAGLARQVRWNDLLNEAATRSGRPPGPHELFCMTAPSR